MAKNILVGVNNIAKKPKNIYVGVNNKARKVKAVYVGVNGIARQAWPTSRIPSTRYTELEYTDGSIGWLEPVELPLSYPRIVITFSCPVISFGSNWVGTLISAECDNYDYDPASDYTKYIAGRKSISYHFTTDFWYDTAEFTCGLFEYTIGSDGYSTGTYDWHPTFNTEGTLQDTIYRLDWMNGNNVYFYNSEGYYSVASHNLLGSPQKRYLTYMDEYHKGHLYILNGRSCKIFSCQMYNGSTLIHDYVPSYRNSDLVLGYYDLIDNTFYQPMNQYGYTNRTLTEAQDAGYYIGPAIG